MHCPHLLLSPVLLQPGCLRPGCVKSFSHLLQLDRQIDGRTSYRYINHAPRIMRVVPGLWLGAICVCVSVGHQPVSYQTKKTTFISYPQSSATSAPSRQRYVHKAPCRPIKSAAACHYHLRRLRQIGRRVGQEVATRPGACDGDFKTGLLQCSTGRSAIGDCHTSTTSSELSGSLDLPAEHS